KNQQRRIPPPQPTAKPRPQIPQSNSTAMLDPLDGLLDDNQPPPRIERPIIPNRNTNNRDNNRDNDGRSSQQHVDLSKQIELMANFEDDF
uniref:Uncharacterized protein n=1 Tax=Panagrolaimus sp. PS1159 TaxID=55785 RepID=A0AC35GD31_9BILA